MKKLLAILAILAFATIAQADTWTFSWTVQQGDVDHVVLHHKVYNGTDTAEQFVNGTGFTDVTLNSNPSTFVLDYPTGTEYAIWGTAYNAAGDSVPLTDTIDGAITTTVWRMKALAPKADAHFEMITPDVEGEMKILITIPQVTR